MFVCLFRGSFLFYPRRVFIIFMIFINYWLERRPLGFEQKHVKLNKKKTSFFISFWQHQMECKKFNRTTDTKEIVVSHLFDIHIYILSLKYNTSTIQSNFLIIS